MPVPSRHLIVVGGPTAAGKTEWAIRLARHFGAGILSADSRQFYREMNIGTAKPSPDERRQAPHHFIDHLSIQDAYSVGDYEREALACLEELFQHQEVVVLTGGSGLYIRALCQGLDEFPEVPLSIRREVEELYTTKGLPALQESLQQLDPDYFSEVDTANPARLMRALSVCRASGRPFSSFRRQAPAPRSFTPTYLQLHWPRPTLYRRIDQRVDQMIRQGLVEEARQLYPFRHLTALQTVGYQELFDFFEEKTSLDEAIDLIKRNSRRYAKRQLTWMRRDGHWKHIGPDDWDIALRYIGWVRNSGGAIVQFPGDAPALSPLLPENSKPDTVLCQRNKTGIEAGLSLYSFRLFLFVKSEKFLTEYKNASTQEFFWHEALCLTEDSPVYAWTPVAMVDFLRRKGFQKADSIPPLLQEKYLVGEDPGAGEHILLFRKGES